MNTAANYGGFILHGIITTTVTITTVVMMPAEPKTYKRKSTQFKPLTAMQEAYCQSYIKTPENQTQAAINAGFSPNTAAVKASVMMRDERIQKRIAELMEERNKRMRVSADYVLMRLVEIDQIIRRQLVLPTRANYTGRTLQCDIKSRLLLPSLSFSCSFHLSVR
ncbi:terminase small subunit, partial [Escherichia coli]